MKILITGACGFIGRALIKELESSHELRLTDRLAPDEATVFVPGSMERAVVPFETRWPFIKAEITDEPAMREAAQGMDAIVHLAAIPVSDPEIGLSIFSLNVNSTYLILDSARRAGVSRVICASSINAFGTIYWRLSGVPVDYPHLPLTEDFPPIPEDPYSLSKLVNEETCAAFSRAYGMKTAAMRFGGVMTAAAYDKMRAEGLQPTTEWNPALWTWVHIQDIVVALRQSLEVPDLPNLGAYTLNAADTACPEPTLDIIRRFKPEYESRLTEPLPGRTALISCARARNAFGYDPKYRLGA